MADLAQAARGNAVNNDTPAQSKELTPDNAVSNAIDSAINVTKSLRDDAQAEHTAEVASDFDMTRDSKTEAPSNQDTALTKGDYDVSIQVSNPVADQSDTFAKVIHFTLPADATVSTKHHRTENGSKISSANFDPMELGGQYDNAHAVSHEYVSELPDGSRQYVIGLYHDFVGNEGVYEIQIGDEVYTVRGDAEAGTKIESGAKAQVTETHAKENVAEVARSEEVQELKPADTKLSLEKKEADFDASEASLLVADVSPEQRDVYASVAVLELPEGVELSVRDTIDHEGYRSSSQYYRDIHHGQNYTDDFGTLYHISSEKTEEGNIRYLIGISNHMKDTNGVLDLKVGDKNFEFAAHQKTGKFTLKDLEETSLQNQPVQEKKSSDAKASSNDFFSEQAKTEVKRTEPERPTRTWHDITNVSGEAHFQQAVLEQSKDRAVIMQFSASWCGPCHQLSGMIDPLVRDPSNDIGKAYVDIDDPNNAALKARYGVESVPTVVVFRNGQEEPVSYVGVAQDGTRQQRQGSRVTGMDLNSYSNVKSSLVDPFLQ